MRAEETWSYMERVKFIEHWLAKHASITALCKQAGISRKTGHAWIKRFKSEGFSGLADKSRKPKSCSHRTDEATEQAIVEARRQHPTWGSDKLKAFLEASQSRNFPASSTIHRVLCSHGLVAPRKKRATKIVVPAPNIPEIIGANELWNADFKGQFKLRKNAGLCYPLTITDTHSRFIICCDALRSTSLAATQASFERVFRERGLPRAIRTDNGTPFASRGVCGLSRLSIWWLRLGIEIVRIQPGKPQQNGSHERMHRTLKAECTRPPAGSFEEQQAIFDRWREEFNALRPHAAIDMRRPAELFDASPRAFPEALPEPEYEDYWELRRVRSDGAIKFSGSHFFISEMLCGEPLGLVERADGVWALYFCGFQLGALDLRLNRFEPMGTTSPGSAGRPYRADSASAAHRRS